MADRAVAHILKLEKRLMKRQRRKRRKAALRQAAAAREAEEEWEDVGGHSESLPVPAPSLQCFLDEEWSLVEPYQRYWSDLPGDAEPPVQLSSRSDVRSALDTEDTAPFTFRHLDPATAVGLMDKRTADGSVVVDGLLALSSGFAPYFSAAKFAHHGAIAVEVNDDTTIDVDLTVKDGKAGGAGIWDPFGRKRQQPKIRPRSYAVFRDVDTGSLEIVWVTDRSAESARTALLKVRKRGRRQKEAPFAFAGFVLQRSAVAECGIERSLWQFYSPAAVSSRVSSKRLPSAVANLYRQPYQSPLVLLSWSWPNDQRPKEWRPSFDETKEALRRVWLSKRLHASISGGRAGAGTTGGRRSTLLDAAEVADLGDGEEEASDDEAPWLCSDFDERLHEHASKMHKRIMKQFNRAKPSVTRHASDLTEGAMNLSVRAARDRAGLQAAASRTGQATATVADLESGEVVQQRTIHRHLHRRRRDEDERQRLSSSGARCPGWNVGDLHEFAQRNGDLVVDSCLVAGRPTGLYVALADKAVAAVEFQRHCLEVSVSFRL